jgi:hypothetical protein
VEHLTGIHREDVGRNNMGIPPTGLSETLTREEYLRYREEDRQKEKVFAKGVKQIYKEAAAYE